MAYEQPYGSRHSLQAVLVCINEHMGVQNHSKKTLITMCFEFWSQVN